MHAHAPGLGILVVMNQPHPYLPLKSIALFMAIALALAGCDKNTLGTIDSRDIVPTVTGLRVAPDSVYIDNLTPNNGTYTTQVTVRANASDPDGKSDLREVAADVLRSDNSVATSGVALHDDGIAPDSVSGDGIFSGIATVSLTRAQAGKFQVRAAAIDQIGAVSNSLYHNLKLTRRNARPRIDPPNAPDSVALSPTDTVLIPITIAASDSDGLADIASVFFFSRVSSTPDDPIFLRDDGGANQSKSGDAVAGDGIFSIIIRLQPNVTRRDYPFEFYAVDSFNDSSAAYVHTLRVY
jgi:hypothetical protein